MANEPKAHSVCIAVRFLACGNSSRGTASTMPEFHDGDSIAVRQPARKVSSSSDGGAGFDVEHGRAEQRLGLRGMRQRVEVLRGTFEVTSVAGAGTRVPGWGGIVTAQKLAVACPASAIVMLTAVEDTDKLLAALTAGARLEGDPPPGR